MSGPPVGPIDSCDTEPFLVQDIGEPTGHVERHVGRGGIPRLNHGGIIGCSAPPVPIVNWEMALPVTYRYLPEGSIAVVHSAALPGSPWKLPGEANAAAQGP